MLISHIGFLLSLALSVVLIVIQGSKARRSQKYFITRLEIDQEWVSLYYTKEGKPTDIEDYRKNFKFKKKFSYNTPYLAVYHRGRLWVTQYEIGEWKKAVFDTVLDEMHYVKPLSEL
jgi:hypothetical protein